MRTIAKLTLSLFAAAAISAPAHAADIFLTLGPVTGEGDLKGRPPIVVPAYQFGAERKGWDGSVKGGSKRSAASAGPTADAAGGAQSDAGAPSPSDPAPGLATGKRQHKPPVTGRLSQGGSFSVTGAFPACSVGAVYATAELSEGSSRHMFTDVTVKACSPTRVSLDYATVEVRGWDPATKRD